MPITISPERACLADTNVLLRLVHQDHPEHVLVKDFVRQTELSGFALFHTTQAIVEFWNVTTRPAHANGMGRTTEDASYLVSIINKLSVLLSDDERIHAQWQQLVTKYEVSGAKVHDARFVAAMSVYEIPRIITRNASDFKRYSQIKVFDPKAGQPVT